MPDLTVKYPHIHLQLTGTDGNALAVVGAVRAVLKGAGVPADEVKDFTDEALSGDYDNVLATAQRWVSVS